MPANIEDPVRRAHEALQVVVGWTANTEEEESAVAADITAAHAAIDAIPVRGHVEHCNCCREQKKLGEAALMNPYNCPKCKREWIEHPYHDSRCAASPGLEGSARGKVREALTKFHIYIADFGPSTEFSKAVALLESALGGGEDA